MDEIINCMIGGIETSCECGPGDRALRRRGGGQLFKLAALPQPIEIWKCSPAVLHEMWIHAVDAKYDHLFSSWLGWV